MTRAGRIMGAMMAMGAGLNSYERDGYARPRERYGMWCWRVAGVQSRPLLRIAAAKAKRARKAAKRRRDAELTRLGRENARFSVAMSMARAPWRVQRALERVSEPGGGWGDVAWTLHVDRRLRRESRAARQAMARRVNRTRHGLGAMVITLNEVQP